MGAVELPDTIRRRLVAEGRLPADGASHGPTARDIRRRTEAKDWPGALMFQCRAAGLPMPAREVLVVPGRRWRFDLAWLDRQVAVEVDGGVYVGGRHTSGSGYEADCVKLAEAACLGWRVLRVTPRHVESGQALGWVTRLLT